MKYKNLVKAISFFGIAVFIFISLNWLVKPIWLEWNNYSTTYGFYNEPKNTIEVIFFGSSVVINGVTPMELYEDYGICAYNFGTEQQPVLASYYWLEEAYRFHSETLHTVVLDCSMLRRTPEIEFYQKAVEGMSFSAIKYHAVKDYTKNFSETLSYLIPFFTYHTRWSSLTRQDFKKSTYDTNNCVRGYNFTLARYFDSGMYHELTASRYIFDTEAEKIELDEEALLYLQKMVDFCNKNNIKLILTKTPAIGSWQSSEHNAVAALAEMYSLDFLDFNCEPLINELEYCYVLDNMDHAHMNYYGASKLTAWFGAYLSKNCDIENIRGNAKYSYMEKQLEEYHRQIANIAELNLIEDPCEYILSAIRNRNYMVFITVKDEGADALREEQREQFASIGLKELANLGYRNSYLAVIEDGNVKYELSKSEKKEGKELTISYEGQLKEGKLYTLTSGGVELGDIASCIIDGVEYAKNLRGLNIVVYDIQNQRVIDSVNFDTCVSSIRDNVNLQALLVKAEIKGKTYNELSENLQKLYLYNYRDNMLYDTASLKQQIKEDSFWDYLSAYWNQENRIIFLSAMDEAAGSFSEAARLTFEENGLHELAALGYRDSYLAVINNGQVLYERKDHGEIPIETKGVNYKMISGGMESGNVSSIQINNTEYSLKTRGINVVIYDTLLNEVVDKASFDTCAIPVHIDN